MKYILQKRKNGKGKLIDVSKHKTMRLAKMKAKRLSKKNKKDIYIIDKY